METSNGDETFNGNAFTFGGKASLSLEQKIPNGIFFRPGFAYRKSAEADGIFDTSCLIYSLDIGVKFGDSEK